MPAGSVLGKKVVTVNGAGEIDFGDIEFKAVGKYTYIEPRCYRKLIGG